MACGAAPFLPTAFRTMAVTVSCLRVDADRLHLPDSYVEPITRSDATGDRQRISSGVQIIDVAGRPGYWGRCRRRPQAGPSGAYGRELRGVRGSVAERQADQLLHLILCVFRGASRFVALVFGRGNRHRCNCHDADVGTSSTPSAITVSSMLYAGLPERRRMVGLVFIVFLSDSSSSFLRCNWPARLRCARLGSSP